MAQPLTTLPKCKARTRLNKSCVHGGAWLGYCEPHYRIIFVEGRKTGPDGFDKLGRGLKSDKVK